MLADRLIVGASGFLGSAIMRKFGPKGTIGTTYSKVSEGLLKFDALNDDLRPILRELKVGAPVIFLFGMTKIDDCARDINKSRRINVEAAIRHIDSALSAKCKPVFISTDAVFDGRKGDYQETDETGPLHQYARQKLEVEEYLASVGASHLVLRLPKVVSALAEKGTLFRGWIEALERSEEIRCAEDQIFSPIEVGDFAECVGALLENGLTGTFHIGGPENLSRADLYDQLIEEIGNEFPNRRTMVRCNFEEFYEVIEDRPLNCSLNCDRLKLALGDHFRLKSMRDVCVEIASNLRSKNGCFGSM